MKTLDLIREISEQAELTQKEVKKVFEIYADLVVEKLKEGDEVPLPGLGKFVAKQRAPRKARNPKTGEIVEVPAKTVLSFKPSSSVKEL